MHVSPHFLPLALEQPLQNKSKSLKTIIQIYCMFVKQKVSVLSLTVWDFLWILFHVNTFSDCFSLVETSHLFCKRQLHETRRLFVVIRKILRDYSHKQNLSRQRNLFCKRLKKNLRLLNVNRTKKTQTFLVPDVREK